MLDYLYVYIKKTEKMTSDDISKLNENSQVRV